MLKNCKKPQGNTKIVLLNYINIKDLAVFSPNALFLKPSSNVSFVFTVMRGEERVACVRGNIANNLHLKMFFLIRHLLYIKYIIVNNLV